MSQTKDERLQVRVDPAVKRRIEEAAAEMGLNLSSFIITAATRMAADVLFERSVIHLSVDAAGAFDEALSRPGGVNARLKETFGRPKNFTWLD
jgi:uncharacterized protein (DUF1778 family)